jgi:hypothetical protein
MTEKEQWIALADRLTSDELQTLLVHGLEGVTNNLRCLQTAKNEDAIFERNATLLECLQAQIHAATLVGNCISECCPNAYATWNRGVSS